MAGQGTVYQGTFVDTPTPNDLRIRHGALWVNADGKIGGSAWSLQESEAVAQKLTGTGMKLVKSGEHGFFFPGFIDTHIHASQYPNSGIFGNSTLLDWLTTYTFPLESSLGNPESPMEPANPLARARQVYSRVVARTLAHGTTTASYYATIHVSATNLLASLCHERGQRAFIGRVCMDRPATCPDYYRDESSEACIRATEATIEHCRALDPSGEFIAPILTPRFAPSCTEQTLNALGDLAKREDLRIQTHIAENKPELELVEALFPDSDSYTHVYDAHNLLTPRTILAHAVHLSPLERALVARRKAKVSHCPASNTALASGFCPVRALLDAGITVGLGTDVSGGFSPSILEAVRQAYLVSRNVEFAEGGNKRFSIGVAEALYLATMGGAKVVGLEGKVGCFEVGMEWDAVQVELDAVKGTGEGEDSSVDIFGWESWDNKVTKWVWGGDDRNVKGVWVGGRLVHERK